MMMIMMMLIVKIIKLKNPLSTIIKVPEHMAYTFTNHAALHWQTTCCFLVVYFATL